MMKAAPIELAELVEDVSGGNGNSSAAPQELSGQRREPGALRLSLNEGRAEGPQCSDGLLDMNFCLK